MLIYIFLSNVKYNSLGINYIKIVKMHNDQVKNV